MSPPLVGGLLILITVAAVYLSFTKDIPFLNEPYEIKAAFRDTSGMRVNSPVRVGGVEVGKVRKVEFTRPGARTAVVTMSILDPGRPIHVDARAQIRPRIFLEGNFFVDLSPGTPSGREMRDGETIPVTRTADSVQLSEVLGVLRRDVRSKLKGAFTSLGEAQQAGAGSAFNSSLDEQGGAYKWSAVVSEALLGEEPGDLSRALRESGVVFGALDRNPARLRTLITDFNRTMAALADSQEDVRASIRELPDTLRIGLPALADLNAAFPSVRRFAREAQPGIRSSGPAARAALPLIRQLRGLVSENELRGLAADLRAATPATAALARETVPLLSEFRELSSCTSNVLVPWGNDRVPDDAFGNSGPVHQEAAKVLPNLAGESRSFDANGQWFKVLGQGGTETFDLGNGTLGTALEPFQGVNPPPDRTLPPYRPDVPCETQEPPNLDTNPGGGPRRLSSGDSDEVQERLEDAQAVATALLQGQLEREGSDLRVSGDRQLTRDIMKSLPKLEGGR